MNWLLFVLVLGIMLLALGVNPGDHDRRADPPRHALDPTRLARRSQIEAAL